MRGKLPERAEKEKAAGAAFSVDFSQSPKMIYNDVSGGQGKRGLQEGTLQ